MTAERTEALDQLGRSFKGTMAAVRRLRGRDTQRCGELSFAQYSLLFGLGEAGELSVRELALAADLAPATVTQMLDRLREMFYDVADAEPPLPAEDEQVGVSVLIRASRPGRRSRRGPSRRS
jgi:hypothetical protein